VGDGGHILTNHHCIANQVDAGDTVVELGAEGRTCNDECAQFRACRGTRFIEGATFISANAALDYALIQVKGDVSSFGFLRIRRTGPVKGEAIYIPQHEHGWGKRIAFVTTFDSVTRGVTSAHDPTIESLTTISCSTGTKRDAGYFADTEHGTSGSPVIARSDNLVIALHHCGGCLNTATPINAILPKIEASLPASAIAP
jgi:lysyl endopeptidase